MWANPDATEIGLDQLWTVMQNEKGDLERRTEEYARWTIPAVCPEDNSAHAEQNKADVAIGARLVNHLANKVVDTMFPHDRPFFTVALTPEMRKELKKELGAGKEAEFAEAVREETAAVEEVAMRKLKLASYRPQAIDVVKHKIISGNAILRRLPDDTRAVYGVKDFCIRRDITGKAQEVLLRDAKKFGNIPPDIQQRVKNVRPGIKETDDCVLYSHFKWDGTRWAFKQGVDSILVDAGKKYKPVDVPILPLVWNLARGEHYGRGLVEDYAVAFHQIDVLTKALIDMIGVMADIKFLVDPSSVLDVAELNASPRGSYHQGRRDDISTPESQRRLEVQATAAIIQNLERELAQAFLLSSAGVRDAERVTAEEIRFIAMELESAFGGLYSRLAIEWQKYEAEYAVSQINFDTELGNSKLPAFEVVVTTGLESLSREGQLDNLRRAINDLALLEGVPEEIRGAINPLKFASFIFTNHSVKWKEFLFSQDEMAANQQAAMQQEQQLINMQSQGAVQVEAGKAAIQESK
jgi:hypothetical protein